MTLYIPARNHGGSGNAPPVIRQVIHCTVSPCVPGGARATAEMFAHTTRDASAHWVFDPTEAVRCLPDSVVGYHAPPNTHTLGYEMCDMQAGSAARWNDAYHMSMMSRCAKQVAADAKHYGLEIRHLTVAQVRAESPHGQCGHIDVSNAFHQTTHTDPGVGFPWSIFLGLVKQFYKGGSLPPPTTGGDMPVQEYSQSVNPQPIVPGQRTLLGCTTITGPTRNGVSFAEGPAYFSGYVAAYVDSPAHYDGPVKFELDTYKLVNGTWVLGSAIDEFAVADGVVPGINKFSRQVQIYLPANYRLRAVLTLPADLAEAEAVPSDPPMIERGFSRLLKWSA